MMLAEPLNHALAAGLDVRRSLREYLIPAPDSAWLWFPALKGPAQRRGGRSIEEWQLALPHLRCLYAKHWLAARLTLNLSVSKVEAVVLVKILDGCGPGRTLTMSIPTDI